MAIHLEAEFTTGKAHARHIARHCDTEGVVEEAQVLSEYLAEVAQEYRNPFTVLARSIGDCSRTVQDRTQLHDAEIKSLVSAANALLEHDNLPQRR